MNQIEKESAVHSVMTGNPRRRHRPRGLRTALLAVALGFVVAAATGAAPAMASFGVQSFDGSVINQDGTPDTQAGSHPWESTTSFLFNTTSTGPDENVKDIITNLPPGLIGNPNATPKCSVTDLDNDNCPGSSQIGQLTLVFDIGGSTIPITVPLYNVVAPQGMAAQFGANVLLLNTFVDISIRTGGDYGVTATVSNASTLIPLIGSTLTLWGVPADPGHDADRTCPGFVSPCSSTAPPQPLLTMPTACSGPLTTSLSADSWQHPGSFVAASFQSHDSGNNPVGVTGCQKLSFNPSISVHTDTSSADSPAGLSVDLHVPQAPPSPTGLATPALKTAVVTLPAGVVVNPGSVDGRTACTQAQIGLNNASEPSCPDSSKLGTAEIDSPLLADPALGSIYLAQQGANPFGTPLAIYATAEADGVLVKLAGKLDMDPSTGQLTTTFDNNPQLPFSDFKLSFFGGPRAPLATPEPCGTFTVNTSLTPWSAPASGGAATPSDSFSTGTGCVGGFAPAFAAGVANPQAGASSPLGLTFSRSDTDEELSGLQVTLPPGLLAAVGSVPQCPDAAANAGTCPAASQVGLAEVGAGPGSDPLFLPGNVFLTGPYKGAPFGLAVVVPGLAGPFNLGTAVVRQALSIDPNDAHVTVTSDPLPTTLGGFQLRVRRVDVNINRPGFMLNPTSCNPMAITGTLTSVGGLAAAVSSRFQVGGCAALPFAPGLTATTNGITSATTGASLDVKLTEGPGQANVRSVSVTLPKALAVQPATIGQACPDATFGSNPGACPGGSNVGTATAVTPLVGAPLTGNVYLVSHASGLPDLDVVLQGSGLTFILVGKVSVTSSGQLASTFGNVPDVPISLFELNLTQSSHPALTTSSNLCQTALVMPTTITAQDGAQVTQNTTVNPTGCPKATTKKAAPTSLTASTRPKRIRRAPFRFTTSGRLGRPTALAASACSGVVSVTFKAGKKTISSRRVNLRSNCTYSSTVKFSLPSRLHPKTLRVFVRYAGNQVMAPISARSYSVRVA